MIPENSETYLGLDLSTQKVTICDKEYYIFSAHIHRKNVLLLSHKFYIQDQYAAGLVLRFILHIISLC